MLERMLLEIHRFHQEVVGLPFPKRPQRLSGRRKSWALTAFREECDEFETAETIEDEADALVDLTYFALGRLLEMGIAPGPVFDEVHAANIRKVRGEKATRPGSLGFDAVKPEGWTPPDVAQYMALTRAEALTVLALRNSCAMSELARLEAPSSNAATDMVARADTRPRLVIMGWGGHGKDTLAELLRDEFGWRYRPTSLVSAGRVILPLVHADFGGRFPFITYAAKRMGLHENQLHTRLDHMKDLYGDDDVVCFGDRCQHRELWYQAICYFNREDPTALAREIFKDSDIYCGMRGIDEIHGVKVAGLADAFVWIDASDRGIPQEGVLSCPATPEMADYCISNSGDVDTLRRRAKWLNQVMHRRADDRSWAELMRRAKV